VDDTTKDHLVVVYDLGGSKATVSVLEVKGGLYRLLGTKVDGALGGHVIDSVVFEFLKKEFLKKSKMDISGNARAEVGGTSAHRPACPSHCSVVSCAVGTGVQIGRVA
jgi:L1 cell adhesion molecule like protein